MKTEKSKIKCPKCEKTFSNAKIRSKSGIKSSPTLKTLNIDDKIILYFCELCSASYDVYFDKCRKSNILEVNTYLLLRNPMFLKTLKDEDQYLDSFKIETKIINII